MPNPFVRRLEHGAALTAADRAALAHLVRRTRDVGPRQYFAHEGDVLPRGHVVLTGWACRSKLLAGGERLITDLVLPGDTCHAQLGLAMRADHSVATLTHCTVADIDATEAAEAIARWPGAARALRWSALQTDSILRQTLINIGRRRAPFRIAHLFCEVSARLRAAGEPAGESFAWPLTQGELADVTAMTSVHVNRSLRELREAGLIALTRRTLRVPSFERLAAFCDFRSEYLHLTPPVIPVVSRDHG